LSCSIFVKIVGCNIWCYLVNLEVSNFSMASVKVYWLDNFWCLGVHKWVIDALVPCRFIDVLFILISCLFLQRKLNGPSDWDKSASGEFWCVWFISNKVGFLIIVITLLIYLFYLIMQYFNEVRPLEAERFKALRIQWTQYNLKVRNQT